MEWAAGGSVSGVPANANPAQVVNLSLGGPGAVSQAYVDVVTRHPDTTFVVAAGNNNEAASGFSPCNTPGVICVGSTAFSARRSSFSNFGPAVDVMGAGGELREDLNGDGYPDGVLSTSFDDDGTPVYKFENGTSMASPHVAGVVSLMVAARRAASPDPAVRRGGRAHPARDGEPHPQLPRGLRRGPGQRGRRGGARGGRRAHRPRAAERERALALLPAPGTQGLTLYNGGGEPLSAAVGVQAGSLTADRITVAPAGGVPVPAGGAATLQVSVRADGLAAGTYTAALGLDAGAAGQTTVALELRVTAAAADRDAVIAFAYQDARASGRSTRGHRPGARGAGLPLHHRAARATTSCSPPSTTTATRSSSRRTAIASASGATRTSFEPVRVVAGRRVDGTPSTSSRRGAPWRGPRLRCHRLRRRAELQGGSGHCR